MKEAKISGQEVFDKGDITVQWGKNAFSVNYVWQTGYHLNKKSVSHITLLFNPNDLQMQI